MADTYTSSLRLQQPTIGGDAATWGGYLNTDLVLIDNAINGFSTINIGGLSAYTLTVGNGVVDQARNLVYNFTGALTGNCTVTLPQSVKFGYAVNSTTGGHHVILTTGSGGSTLSLPAAAYYQFFFCDSSNVFSPSIGYGYANFLNDVAVNGALTVTGTTTLSGTLNGQAINGTTVTGSVNVVCGSWYVSTNGDQHIPYLNGNLSSFLNQSVATTAGPTFADVGLSGLGFLKASFINQPVMTTSSPTFNNVWFTYLGNYLSAYVNQAVLTTSNPTFGNVYLSYFGDFLSNIVNQRVRTVDTPTFQDVHWSYLGLNASAVINQDVRTIATPRFADIDLPFVNGGQVSAVLNQDVRSIATPSFADAHMNFLGVNLSAVLNQDVRTIASPTFVTVHQTSDATLKENIAPLSGSLDRLVRISGVSYTLKESGAPGVGVLAQEVRPHFPEMVREDDSGLLSVNYSAFVAPLIEAVKELRAEVLALKAKLA